MSDAPPQPAPPTDEHRWLARLAGEWSYEGRSIPDDAACRMTGVETVRTWGDYWILAEAEGDAGPSSMRSLITLGYDPDQGRFVGSFIGTMMTSFWPYQGALDADGRRLVLDSTGPSFDDPTRTAAYQDIIEIVSDDERLLRAQVQGDDGRWTEFMVTRYRRKA